MIIYSLTLIETLGVVSGVVKDLKVYIMVVLKKEVDRILK